MDMRYPLALLLLALIPLVLFMRRQRPTVRRHVSNLFLWSRATPDNTPAFVRHLRRHWLVVLQATCLGVIAVAASGVQLDRSSVVVAVILDASLTMGTDHDGGMRFDTAREKAVELIGGLPRRTRVRLIVADPGPRLVGEFSASDAALGRALDGVRVTHAAADVERVVEFARNAPVRASRFYVFSDASPLDPVAHKDVEWVAIGTAADNAAISDITWRRSTTERRGIEVLVRIANQGRTAVNADLSLAIDDEWTGQQRVNVPPLGRMEYSFTLADRTGIVTARLAHGDALRSDNTRSVIVPPPAGVRILLTGEAGFFLKSALQTHPGVTVVTSPQAEHDVIVCNRCRTPPTGSADVLMFTPPESGGRRPLVVLKSAVEHPVTEGIELDGTLGLPTASGTLPGSVLAVAGNAPAILAQDTGGRRILEVRLDSDEGPFPLSTAFPLLVSSAVGWLSHRDEDRTMLTAGEALEWNVGPQGEAPVVLGPDNRVLFSRFENGVLSLTDTRMAGTYRIRLASGDRAVAVNPAVRSGPEAERVLRPGVFDDGAVAAAGAATDLTVLLALTALLLLTLEWLYASRVRG
jgi:hypothetical protein